MFDEYEIHESSPMLAPVQETLSAAGFCRAEKLCHLRDNMLLQRGHERQRGHRAFVYGLVGVIMSSSRDDMNVYTYIRYIYIYNIIHIYI